MVNKAVARKHKLRKLKKLLNLRTTSRRKTAKKKKTLKTQLSIGKVRKPLVASIQVEKKTDKGHYVTILSVMDGILVACIQVKKTDKGPYATVLSVIDGIATVSGKNVLFGNCFYQFALTLGVYDLKSVFYGEIVLSGHGFYDLYWVGFTLGLAQVLTEFYGAPVFLVSLPPEAPLKMLVRFSSLALKEVERVPPWEETWEAEAMVWWVGFFPATVVCYFIFFVVYGEE